MAFGRFTPAISPNNVFKQGLFTVAFNKKTGPNKFELCTVSFGLLKKGGVLPVLTLKAFYELIAYDSKPKPSISRFRKLYNLFVHNPKNSLFIINQENITFGKGGHSKTSINGEGLLAFAKANQHNFQLCSETLNCFIDSILDEINTMGYSANFSINNRSLPGRTGLHQYFLYKWLCENITLDPQFFWTVELQGLLLSQNTFYILEMKNLHFRVGFSLDY